MAKASPPYTSFNGGEVSPELEGRIDIEKYHNSLFRCRNMIPLIQGPARRRSGTRFVKEVKDSTKPPFLAKFVFNVTQSFILEWGDRYVRFYTNHGAVLEATKAITGASQASPAVITSNGHGYANGDEVFISGVMGMTRLNNRYFKVTGATLNTFALQDFGGNPIDSTAYAAYISGGTVGRVYTVTTPYLYADLFDSNGLFTLRFAPIADVVYITNVLSTYPVQKLSRFGNNNWTMAPVVFSAGPFKALNPLNTPVMHASGQVGSVTVTSSAPIPNGTPTPGFLAGHVGALLYLATHDIHTVKPWETGKGYALGALVRYNGVTYKCFDAGTSGTVPPTHLFGDAYDGSKSASAGWTYQDPGYGWGKITAVSSPTVCTVLVGDPVSIDPPIQYPIGVTDLDVNWSNAGTGANTPTPLWALSAWNAVDGYPTHVYFFLNRLCFVRFQDMQFSVSEDFENFAAKTPGGVVTDDMAISITAQTQEIIEWLQEATSVSALGVGTSGSELIVGAITESQPFSPTNARISPQGTRGSRAIPAFRIANGIIFVQTSGKKVRKLVYEFYTNSWQSTDLTILAPEMTAKGLVAMDYQQEPDSVLWSIRQAL